MPGTPCGQSHENTCNAKLKVDDSSLSSYPYESGFFPILISFHPAPEADPQVGHRANTVHFARYFFRLPFRLHLRSLLATSPESMRGLVKIVQLSSPP